MSEKATINERLDRQLCVLLTGVDGFCVLGVLVHVIRHWSSLGGLRSDELLLAFMFCALLSFLWVEKRQFRDFLIVSAIWWMVVNLLCTHL